MKTLTVGKRIFAGLEVTQRTAANAEESASASEELNSQSQALMAVVEQL
jgi:methyl-accepting chemotaxis protein